MLESIQNHPPLNKFYIDSHFYMFSHCFLHIVSFIKFTSSRDFFPSSPINSSLWIGPKTGFTDIVLSFNCWYSLNISTTACYPNCLIPFFSEIYVNITLCSRDIYLSMYLLVSYFIIIINNWWCCPCTEILPSNLFIVSPRLSQHLIF